MHIVTVSVTVSLTKIQMILKKGLLTELEKINEKKRSSERQYFLGVRPVLVFR